MGTQRLLVLMELIKCHKVIVSVWGFPEKASRSVYIYIYTQGKIYFKEFAYVRKAGKSKLGRVCWQRGDRGKS